MWERHNALKCKEKIGSISELENCKKTFFFSNSAFMVFFFELCWNFKCVIFLSHKNFYFFSKKSLKLFTRGGHGDIALAPNPRFQMPKTFELTNIPFSYGTSIHLKNMNSQYFAIFLENTFRKIREKKWFNQAMGFAFRKLLKTWESVISGRLHRGPNWWNCGLKIDNFYVYNLAMFSI